MKGTALALLLCCTLLAFASQVGHCAEITVDASTSLGPVNTRLFGHNTVYLNGIEGMWDASSRELKSGAQDAMETAGIGTNALVRFPGGNHNDTYQWRRGVGPYNLRPYDDNPWEEPNGLEYDYHTPR